MPRTKRQKPLYQRGPFKLYPRNGRNLEIVWYDEGARRERSVSAGTSDHGEGRLALDRHYLAATGTPVCHACGQALGGRGTPLLTDAITDYLLLSEGKAGFEKATKGRLAHVIDYVAETNPAVTVAQIDTRWVDRFRAWLHKRPVVSPTGKVLRQRSLGHVEGCVRQLAAAINASGHKATFRAEQPKAVSKSPVYRANVQMLAAMFRFALEKPERANLLRYLRIAVATWARPDAIFDVREGQWFAAARVLDLNPPGRRQTKKHRPQVPVARQFAPWLDEMRGHYLPVSTVRATWEKMRDELGLPSGGESGPKLIRRSMATIARARIGEANWRQGEMMLGHVKASVSDIYALPDPLNLGLALAATEAVIDEIEALAPGAFRKAHGLRVVA